MSIKDRGFASMLRTHQRAIASMGGKAVQAKGTGHRFTSATAMLAGRKGGEAAAAKRRAEKEAQ